MEDDGYDTVWPELGRRGTKPPPPALPDDDRGVELREDDIWIDHSIPDGPPVIGWFPRQRCPS